MLDEEDEPPIMVAFSTLDEMVDFLDWMREHLHSREAVEVWVETQFVTIKRELAVRNHPSGTSEQFLTDALFWDMIDSLDEEHDDGVPHPD